MRYECKHCDAKFKQLRSYTLHNRTAHRTEHVCDSCGCYFESQDKLDNHKNTTNVCTKAPQIVFKCNMCDKRFTKLHGWYRHVLRHADEKDFPQNPPAECLICGHKNASWTDWRNHILTEHRYKAGRKNLTVSCICEICGKTLSNENNLSGHMLMHHQSTNNANPSEALSPSRETCKICNASILTNGMKRHIKVTHRVKKVFACDVCGKKFNRAVTRNEHAQKVHGVVDEAQADKEAAVNAEPNIWQDACKVCNKNILRINMKRHVSQHTGVKPYACNVCGKSYTRASSRNDHVRKAHTESDEQNKSNFQCQLCPQKYKRRSNLILHERFHTGEKPFSCDICERSFISRLALGAHQITHPKINPLSCDTCQRTFVTQQHLTVHQMICTKQTFSCDLCQRTYLTKDCLKRHLKRHTRKDTFSCDECQRKFTSKYNLILHQQLHTGQMSFSCDICNKKFNHHNNFIRHGLVHSTTKDWTCELCGNSFKCSDSLKLHTKTVHAKIPNPPRKPRKKK